MSLDDLVDDVDAAYADLDDRLDVALDRETRTELAMLLAAQEPESPEELVRRAVHLLFQSTVDAGKLDFLLRSEYDVTYDEYLSGMTFEEMAGANQPPKRDDDHRYQF